MSSAAADRNLLFGILALQMDFISRDALVGAMHAWVLDKARPLGEILTAQGALGPDEHALLAALVQKHLERHGGDPRKSLVALSTVGSLRQDLDRVGDADLHASLALVSRGQAEDSSATRPPSAGARTSDGLRFRILRPHARGGLGQVYVARDEELNREVALKEIQEPHADHPESRARFLLEAEITGGLEHPGIVPVYGLGTYADGRPFYAMRFIKGDSLHDAIKRFHTDARPADLGRHGLALRQLLGRFVDVCNAISYAHSRGVLHRDLKPGNILLGPYGETLVVDWGLAKPLGAKGEPGEGGLRPGSAGGTTPTRAGSVLGTPQYMSPEQAAGRIEELGAASDVYSLGATLYQLLTGRPPFTADDAGTVLRQVQAGDFPRPRQTNSTAPTGLEAVCLKAMALRPADRYPSARALAEDVEHWLADEPLLARPESRLQRLGRWARRHRSWVAAGVAALLLVTAVSVTAALLINTSLESEKKARHGEGQQRQQAERALGESQRLSAHLALDRGLGLLERGDKGAAMLWLARGLELAAGQAPQTETCARLNLPRTIHSPLFRSLTLPQFSGFFTAGDVSSDGRLLLLALEGGEVHLSDAQTGKALGEPFRGKGHINHVALSPDTEKVLAAAANEIRIWDRKTRELLCVLSPQGGFLMGVAFSPDGTLVATKSFHSENGEAEVRLWSARTGKPAGQPLRLKGRVTALTFRPDGRVLLTGSAEGIRLWDVVNGKPLTPRRAPEGGALGGNFSADGRTVYSAHLAPPREDYAFQVWDLARRQPLGDESLLPPGTTEVRLWGDGKAVFAWGPGRPAVLLDAGSGRKLRQLMPVRPGDSWLQVSDNERSLLTVSYERIRAWDVAAGTAARSVPSSIPLPTIVLSPDGRTLLRAETQYPRVRDASNLRGALEQIRTRVSFWKTATGEQVGEGLTLEGIMPQVVFSRDGREVLLAFQAQLGTRVERLDVASASRRGKAVNLAGHLEHAVFRSSEWYVLTKEMAVGSGATLRSQARLWRVGSGEALGTPFPCEGQLTGGFSPGGDKLLLLAAGARGVQSQGKLHLWEIPTLRPLAQVAVAAGSLPSFSPDGKQVALARVGPEESEVRLLDARTGKEAAAPLTAPGRVYSVRFGSAGPVALFLSGSAAQQRWVARRWDPDTGEAAGPTHEMDGPVENVQFSPDGLLVTGVMLTDIRRRFWELATGRLLADPERDHLSAYSLPGRFTEDGRYFFRLVGNVIRFQLPRPLAGSPERITCWAELTARKRLEQDGTIRPLSDEELRQRAARLKTLGGSPAE